jgi:hypothetical protein
VKLSKKQHKLALRLLKKLGVDYLRLESRDGRTYRYHGWTTPLVDGNGSAAISRCGIVHLTK